MKFEFLKASGLRQLFGVFNTEYIPEEGEVVIKVFKDVWNQTARFSKKTLNDLVITDKKMVISAIIGGGYPGYNFYFDPSTKLDFFDDNSVIENVEIEGDTIWVKSRGNYKYIKVTDKNRIQEMYDLLQDRLNSLKK